MWQERILTPFRMSISSMVSQGKCARHLPIMWHPSHILRYLSFLLTPKNCDKSFSHGDTSAFIVKLVMFCEFCIRELIPAWDRFIFDMSTIRKLGQNLPTIVRALEVSRWGCEKSTLLRKFPQRSNTCLRAAVSTDCLRIFGLRPQLAEDKSSLFTARQDSWLTACHRLHTAQKLNIIFSTSHLKNQIKEFRW